MDKITPEDLKIEFDNIRPIYKKFIEAANLNSLNKFIEFMEENQLTAYMNFAYQQRYILNSDTNVDHGINVSLSEDEKAKLLKHCLNYQILENKYYKQCLDSNTL